MFRSRNKRLTLALAVACCTLGALASAEAEQASGSTGCNGSAGFNLELGIVNACDRDTYLSGPGITVSGTGGNELSALTSNSNGVAIYAEGTSTTGHGGGVAGITDGAAAGAYGVRGELGDTAPGNPSAGVYGRSNSSTGNGPGVFGEHVINIGTAPGVAGYSASA